MEMPFGKHRGRPIEDIPTAYLKWLLTIELYDVLRNAVEEELELRREGFDRRRQQPPPPPTVDVAAWYRRLSMRFHPDRGGSKDAMQAINAARELLEDMMR